MVDRRTSHEASICHRQLCFVVVVFRALLPCAVVGRNVAHCFWCKCGLRQQQHCSIFIVLYASIVALPGWYVLEFGWNSYDYCF